MLKAVKQAAAIAHSGWMQLGNTIDFTDTHRQYRKPKETQRNPNNPNKPKKSQRNPQRRSHSMPGKKKPHMHDTQRASSLNSSSFYLSITSYHPSQPQCPVARSLARPLANCPRRPRCRSGSSTKKSWPKARNVQTLGYRLTSLAAKVEDRWLANDFFIMLKPCLRCSSSTTPITKSNSQTSRRPCKISTAKSANSGRILKNCEPVCKAAWEQYLAYLGGLRRILVRFHGLFAGHHVNMQCLFSLSSPHMMPH